MPLSLSRLKQVLFFNLSEENIRRKFGTCYAADNSATLSDIWSSLNRINHAILALKIFKQESP